MSWLAFKNGLLLKLADILQSLAAWLTPEVHAPRPQEDSHPQVEDSSGAQGIRRYKVSRPPEDWQSLDESSGGDSCALIGGEVVRDPGEQPHPSQESGSQQSWLQQAGLKQAGLNQESLAAYVAKNLSSHQPRIEPGPETRSLGERIPEAVVEPAAMPLTERILQHQEPQASTAVLGATTQKPNESAEEPRNPKQQSWLFQAARKIVTRFRSAAQSSAAPQARRAEPKPASINHIEPPGVFSEANESNTREQESQPELAAAHEQERQEPSSTKHEIKSGKAVAAELPRLTRHRQFLPELPLPEQDEIIAKYDGNDAPRTSPQPHLRRQREIVTPVMLWPTPPVRVAAESERWPMPVPVFLGARERNLTAAASSSWTQAPNQEIAPGLPLLPQELRPSQEGSGDSAALYPWPELPQVVEENPDEPRKLLQTHERQMRVLREQRGAW